MRWIRIFKRIRLAPGTPTTSFDWLAVNPDGEDRMWEGFLYEVSFAFFFLLLALPELSFRCICLHSSGKLR